MALTPPLQSDPSQPAEVGLDLICSPQEHRHIVFPWLLNNTAHPTRICWLQLTLLDRTPLVTRCGLELRALSSNRHIRHIRYKQYLWTVSTLSFKALFFFEPWESRPQRIWPSSSGWGDQEAKNGLFVLVTTILQLSSRKQRDTVF